MKQFTCVAYERNITKASEKLFISQQALSKSIGCLENELGVKLFTRSERGTELTQVGMKILPVVESLLKKFDEHVFIIQSIVKNNKYALTISFENQVLLNVIPFDFMSTMGNIKIRSVLATDATQCINDVKNKKVDLSFCCKPKELRGLSYIPVIHRRPVVIMNKDHYLARKKTINLSDLKNEAHMWITFNSVFSDDYMKVCIDNGFYPRIVSEFPSVDKLLQAIAEGAGITIGGNLSFANHEDDLIRRPLVYDSLMIEIGFIAKPDYKTYIEINSFINAFTAYAYAET